MPFATHEPLAFPGKTPDDLFPEKTASAIARVPDDDAKWPAFVHSELLRNVPYLATYDVEIVLDRVEPDAGAALGYAQIQNRTAARPQDGAGRSGNVIRVPIIITDRKLERFLVFDAGQMYPLTEQRVQQAMLSPSPFDTTSRTIPCTPSLTDQLYPPHQQRQGFGRVVDGGAPGLSKIGEAPSEQEKTAGIPMPHSYRQFGGGWLVQFEDTPFYKEALALNVEEASVRADEARRSAEDQLHWVAQSGTDAEVAELEGKYASWMWNNYGQRQSETLSKLASARDGSTLWSDCFRSSPLHGEALVLEEKVAGRNLARAQRQLLGLPSRERSARLEVASAALESKLASWRRALSGTEKTASGDQSTPRRTVNGGMAGLGAGALVGHAGEKKRAESGTPARRSFHLKESMVALNFMRGSGAPGQAVFQQGEDRRQIARCQQLKKEPKLMPGVLPANFWFYPLQGTDLLMGIPESHQKILEEEQDAQKKRRALMSLAHKEIVAARTKQPSPGKLILVRRTKDGYQYQPPRTGMDKAAAGAAGGKAASAPELRAEDAAMRVYMPGMGATELEDAIYTDLLAPPPHPGEGPSVALPLALVGGTLGYAAGLPIGAAGRLLRIPGARYAPEAGAGLGAAVGGLSGAAYQRAMRGPEGDAIYAERLQRHARLTKNPGLARATARALVREWEQNAPGSLATAKEAGDPVLEVPRDGARVVLHPPAKRTGKDAKYPFQAFIDFQGLQIDVENKKGSSRSGTDSDGNKWTTKMFHHYGEIRDTEGADGDKLDVYVGDNHDSSLVVVVHQCDPHTGKYDEDKVMLGFNSVEEAIGGYKNQYDKPGFYREGQHTVMSLGRFWRWVHDKNKHGRKVASAMLQLGEAP